MPRHRLPPLTRPSLAPPAALAALAASAASAVCVAALLGLSGCADLQQLRSGTPQVDALLAAPPAGLPRAAMLADTPFFAQEVAQCGPAALATVLVQRGVATTPDALVAQVFTPGREGSLQVDMLTAARRAGQLAVRVQPRLVALLREVAAGRPVLVLINPALDVWPRWHYAVVVGYDLGAGTVTMRSGREREARWPLHTFMHAWQRSHQWGFVVSDPAQPPATATPSDLVDAVTAYARVQPPPSARVAYLAAQALQPRSPVLALGLAQTWADERQWPAAIAALEQAVAWGGGAAALNNLAMVLWQSGEAAQVARARAVAQQAVDAAQAREPAWLGVAQATLREVQQAPP